MSVAFIRIKSGSYRTTDVSGHVFQLAKPFKNGRRGGYITANNSGKFPGFPEKIRIKLNDRSHYEFVTAEHYVPDIVLTETETMAPTQLVDEKSEQERMAEIAERFEILHDMTKAAASGEIRAMIVSGPPGVGKSFGVEQEIEKATLLDQIAGRKLRAEVVKGSASAIGLYQVLFKYSDENCVVVFDDCDSILIDDVALNLLKGALDSGKKRKISWLADSNILRHEGIPNSFEFKGSVIFITNLKFDQMKSQKLRDHLDALQSRCHYLDLTLDSMRDKILRIKQIAATGELFADLEIGAEGQAEIIDFMNMHQNRLREMSLRMAIKIGQLYKSFPARWQSLASTTCMKSA
jgi:hypothetical protein